MITKDNKHIYYNTASLLILAALLCISSNLNGESIEASLSEGEKTNNVLNIELQFKALDELLMENFITIQDYNKKKTELIKELDSIGTKTGFSKLKKLMNDGVISEAEYKITTTPPYIMFQEPEYLSFDELQKLYHDPLLEGDSYLQDKTYRFFRTPIIDNRPYYNGAKPVHHNDSRIGEFLRVASWNIEKSLQMKDAIAVFSSEEELRKRIDKSKIKNEKELNLILKQRERLATADIIVLQEMEIGIKRSDYLNAAAELAKTLNMNYTYGAQYLEIDPVQLGIEKILLEDGQFDKEAADFYSVNSDLYKGVFGSAVLSRYPIKRVTLFPLDSQGYDWYFEEKENTSFLEKSRRIGSKVTFKNEITREMKTGGRHFYRIDLDVPGLPNDTLTIINIHLEIKCLPDARDLQIKEILSYIKEIDNHVIMLGDFNSAPVDLSPTTITRAVKRGIKKPTNWLSASVNYLTPYGFIINTSRGISNATKNLQNPLAMHVPIIAPNVVKKMFQRIEDFRFDDGGAFDFRGDAKHSVNGKSGKLANANQRDLKGFKTSFKVKRVIAKIIGTFRLDWVFVKSLLKDPLDQSGPYKFAPHYSETLSELNGNLFQKISDHDPNVIDFPFNEPNL